MASTKPATLTGPKVGKASATPVSGSTRQSYDKGKMAKVGAPKVGKAHRTPVSGDGGKQGQVGGGSSSLYRSKRAPY